MKKTKTIEKKRQRQRHICLTCHHASNQESIREKIHNKKDKDNDKDDKKDKNKGTSISPVSVPATRRAWEKKNK